MTEEQVRYNIYAFTAEAKRAHTNAQRARTMEKYAYWKTKQYKAEQQVARNEARLAALRTPEAPPCG